MALSRHLSDFTKYGTTHQIKNYSHSTKLNTTTLKNCKQTKYQPIREGKLIKYKIINKC
jgi:hypothetical protein